MSTVCECCEVRKAIYTVDGCLMCKDCAQAHVAMGREAGCSQRLSGLRRASDGQAVWVW